MTIDFYYTPGSPPCRIVQLTAKAVGVELNLKHVDIMKGENMTPEFLKMSPAHALPVIVDNGLVLTESRAIATYLISKYGKNDSLYPKDPTKRAQVDQRLYFDIGTLYSAFANAYYPLMFGKCPISPEKQKAMDDAYQLLDTYLAKTGWAVGDSLTVADISLAASVSSAEACEFNITKYPNVVKWFAKCKTTIAGYAEINGVGVEKLKGMYTALTKQ